MSNVSILVLFTLVIASQATLLMNENTAKMLQSQDPTGNYLILPTEIDKLKRSFGRNCMFTISGCFTSSQAERYRKYMENVRFIPK